MSEIQQFLLTLESWQVYLALLLFMATNGFLSTPPSEATWATAGYLAYLGIISPLVGLVVGVIGNVLGTTTLFWIASRWGRKAVRRIFSINPLLGESVLNLSTQVFEKHGEIIVALGRCVPNVRSVISAPAGLGRMVLSKFIIYTTIGCLAWGIIWGGVGLFLGEYVFDLVEGVKVVFLVIAGVIVLIVGIVVWRMITKSIEKPD